MSERWAWIGSSLFVDLAKITRVEFYKAVVSDYDSHPEVHQGDFVAAVSMQGESYFILARGEALALHAYLHRFVKAEHVTVAIGESDGQEGVPTHHLSPADHGVDRDGEYDPG